MIQNDGKIIIVGCSDDASHLLSGVAFSNYCDSWVARYDIQGKLDTSSGPNKDGIVITSASQQSNYFVNLTLQSDGKIIAVGSAKNARTDKNQFLVVRYSKEGLLDTSFGKDHTGIVLTPLGDSDASAKDVALQKDGKILVIGVAQWGEYKKFTLVRYTSEGLMDTTFGPNKDGIIVSFLREADDRSIALSVQTDGKIIVAGDSFNGNYCDLVLVRYNY